MEWLIAVGLGVAAGTNAYIPLLVLGSVAKWTPLVTLPESWSWLTSEWTLAVLAALIAIEFLAQRVPGLATVSDVVQTALRPTSAGLAVSAQGANTTVITDAGQWWSEGQWIPVAIAVGVALTVHLAKLTLRAFVDSLSAGVFGGLFASVDEGSSLLFSVTALLAPLLIPVVLVVIVGGVWWAVRRRVRRSRQEPPLND
jgi:hypothetical protein